MTKSPTSYVKSIRESVSTMAVDVLPEQVFVQVDERGQSISITWRNSALVSQEQRSAILARAQALLPATMKGFRLAIT